MHRMHCDLRISFSLAMLFVFFLALAIGPSSRADLTSWPEPPPPPAAAVDALAYRIDAAISDDAITAKIALHASSRRAVRKLELELASAMTVTSCALEGADVPVEHDKWQLTLDLAAAGSPKGEFTLEFEVTGRPSNIFSKQRGGFVRTAVNAEHAYIRSQYAWYPRVPDDPARYETDLVVKPEWKVRTAGALLQAKEEEGGCRWSFKRDTPVRRIGLVAGDYTVCERRTSSGLVIDVLHHAGQEEGAGALAEAADRALTFYASLFGPVALDRFTLVAMPPAFGTGSGYGEAGYVLIGSGAFSPEGSVGWGTSLVAHEVAHSWWGQEVDFSNFASEMLATYTTSRYIERFDGEASATGERRGFVKRIVSTATGRGEVDLAGITGFGGNVHPQVYRAHAYDKASMILHILEREMGREALDASLRSFFEKSRGTTQDYRSACKRIGGSKWKWLFEQWGRPGIPLLAEEHSVKTSRKGCTVSGTLTQEGAKKPFRMNVPIRAVAGDRTHDHLVAMKKAKATFKFRCPFVPEAIEIDPDCHLVVGAAGPGDLTAIKDRAFRVVSNPGEKDETLLLRTIDDFRTLLRNGCQGAKESECRAAIGRCQFRLGRLDDAKKTLEEAIAMGDSGPFWRAWINLRLGCIADLKKNRSVAEKHYKSVLGGPEARNMAHQKGLADRFLKKPYRGYEKDG